MSELLLALAMICKVDCASAGNVDYCQNVQRRCVAEIFPCANSARKTLTIPDDKIASCFWSRPK